MTGAPLGRRALLLAGAAAALRPGTAAASRFEALFAPSARLWPRWTAHDPAATAMVDHSTWDAFLARYHRLGADGIARVAYAAVTPADRQALGAYLMRLSVAPVSRLNRDEQFAFWANLYNALTVKVVLDAYPVRSIREIDSSPGLFARGPWGATLVSVENEALTLDDIEHRILRPIWRDPRVHYAVNCASLGCPNLMERIFTAAAKEALLEHGARLYANHPRGARIMGDRLVLSSLYAWFAEDFGGEDEAVIGHLVRYAEPTRAARLAFFRRIDDFAYDWGLNDAS